MIKKLIFGELFPWWRENCRNIFCLIIIIKRVDIAHESVSAKILT